MDDNPFVKITNEATKEALMAQRAHQIEVQRRRVEDLAEQIQHRLAELRQKVRLVEDAVGHANSEAAVRFHHGAFGHDTVTVDELLRALGEESETLTNMQAAEAATDRLAAKYEAMMSVVPDQPEADQPVAVGGQYL